MRRRWRRRRADAPVDHHLDVPHACQSSLEVFEQLGPALRDDDEDLHTGRVPHQRRVSLSRVTIILGLPAHPSKIAAVQGLCDRLSRNSTDKRALRRSEARGNTVPTSGNVTCAVPDIALGGYVRVVTGLAFIKLSSGY